MSEILGAVIGALIVAFLLIQFAEAIAAAVGTLLESGTRWIFKHLFGIDRPRTGADSMVGKRVLVQERFAPGEKSGQLEGYVAINGERWLARAADGSRQFESGETLSVLGREGLVLLVSQVETE